MSYKGRVFTNPNTGEYLEFVSTSEENAGQHSTLKVLIKSGGFKPVMHQHLHQDESFEVISGRLSYVVGDKQGSIGPGEKITMPKGVAHTHFNAEAEDLIMYQTASPALDFEPFVASLSHLINNGKVPNGKPPFLQLMLWMNHLKGKTCVANIPIGVQKLLAAVLAPVGKLAGYKVFYE